MGKRSKSKKIAVEESATNKKIKFDNCAETTTHQIDTIEHEEIKVKTKKQKFKESVTNESIECVDREIKVKPKKQTSEENVTHDTIASLDKEIKDKTKIKKGKQQTESNENVDATDNGPIETQNKPRKGRKNKREHLPQNDEEAVKDEDIDEFCDQLSAEDNVQYEDWVKLVEAKLHSNTKKPK